MARLASSRPIGLAVVPRALELPADARDWRRFYAEHWAFVYRIVARFAGSGVSVEDATQDVFMVAVDRLHAFEGRSAIRTWLYRVALNVASEHRRKRMRHDRLERALSVITFWRGPNPPDLVFETADALARVQRLLDQMSEKRRQVVLLCELEDLSAEEAGAVLGVPAATVRTRLFEARRELARRVAAEEGA